MTDLERALYQAWFKQYTGHCHRGVFEVMTDAMNAGIDIDAIMDRAAKDSATLRERNYRRALRARPLDANLL